MIAEFDAMVGAYMQAIRDIGEWDNTIFIVTSDHGDLQMEHQQSYKMSPYDASVSVPLILHDGRVSKDIGKKTRRKRVIDKPTQLIDLYPTIMDLAGVSHTDYTFDMLDGHSLIPLMTDNYSNSDETSPDFVVSQFHGDNIAMSWFLIVRRMPCIPNNNAAHDIEERQLSNTRTKMCTMKLVVYGTGVEIEHQLFDVTHDPDEMTNLASNQTYLPMMISLEQTLRSVVDYPRVALNVARYNQQSMKHWMEVTGDPEWRTAIHSKGLRWDDAFDYDVEGSFKALEEWVNGRAKILPCRSDLVWPPPSLIEVQE
jgi:arylsulfatase K